MGVPEKALIAADEIVEYIPQRPPIVMADAFYLKKVCPRSY